MGIKLFGSGRSIITTTGVPTAAAGTYAAITTSDATLSSGASSTNSGVAQVHFKTLWSNDFTAASNAPGSYALPIVFTLSAP